MHVMCLNNITHIFNEKTAPLHVLKNVNLTLNAGQIVALKGPSGSGKSTLLQIMGLLESPTSGSIAIENHDISNANDTKRTQIRRKSIGFVYQFHHLLPEFTALENVIIPQLIDGVDKKIAKHRAKDLLHLFNMDHRFDHTPQTLSGGEQQRIAMARALANDPKILLADEPTGNLDQKTAHVVFDEMLKIVQKTGLTALIATHDNQLADHMDHILTLHDGQIV